MLIKFLMNRLFPAKPIKYNFADKQRKTVCLLSFLATQLLPKSIMYWMDVPLLIVVILYCCKELNDRINVFSYIS